MGTIKKDGDNVYIQHLDKMRKVGHIVHGIMKTEKGEEDIATLVVQRNRDSHLLLVWQAYGFAKDVMDHEDWFSYVQVEEQVGNKTNTYMVPRPDLVLHGRIYETDNFERQYFVTLDKLQKYKV